MKPDTDKPEPDLIEAMVKAMKEATRQDHGGTGREPPSVFSDELDILAEAAARVMFLLLDAEMNAYPTTPGSLVLDRVARENGLK